MPQHFSCTACGRCCHNLHLTLSVQEAIDWILRDGNVKILCHAAPETDDEDEIAVYKRQRRFAAQSGSLVVQVQVILVAHFKGACPNLKPDMLCGIYNERPNVCSIYPAEIMPGMPINPSARLCPTEAWGINQPIFAASDGKVLDQETHDAIIKARATSLADAHARRRLTSILGINIAALENEGFAVWTIDQTRLLQGLNDASLANVSVDTIFTSSTWKFMTPRAKTARIITETGADLIGKLHPAELDYIPLF